MHGWAEGSLKVADEILEDHFAVSRPWNFTANDLNQIVQQTNSQECTAAPAAGSSSQSAGSGGGADDATAALLCFTADALVEMGDGSFKTIQSVVLGDKVSTGDGNTGIVTETLVHPVNAVVPVAKMATPHGVLVGTPDHPVYHERKWIELGKVKNHDVTIEEDFVENFYNLEIDGHILEGSLHSYVANGVVASGLGDNEELNRRFPRQKEWKALVEEEK